MGKIVRIHETGAPSVMRLEHQETPQPGPGEVLIRHGAIGVNFIDTYFRSGLYSAPGGLPFTPGSEGAGVITALGDHVTDFRVGDRVVYVGPPGSYAEERIMPAARLVPIPQDISDQTAAAALLKGLTVHYLLTRTFHVGPQHKVLFHAGAGGVGLIAGQWLRRIGCLAIATVGSAEKMAAAKAAGYSFLVNYREEDFAARVKDITGGEGCDVVYDSVGKDTFPASLDCLKPLGLFVSFGNASGPLPPVDLQLLSQKGSLFATRPTLFTYIAKRADLLAGAEDLFAMIRAGMKIEIGQTFPLSDVVRCHEALESRQTVGATVLTV